jgi:uncharacterized protein (TIGR02246 family)
VSRAAVLARVRAQTAAWNRGDLAGFMASYTADAIYVSGSQVVRGREAIHARYRERYGERTTGKLALEVLDVRLVHATAAVVLGRFAVGRKARGTFSLVLSRTDDGWRVVHDHTASD